jgi:hypothetical protein
MNELQGNGKYPERERERESVPQNGSDYSRYHTRLDPASNQNRHGGKLAASHLSYGMLVHLVLE